MEDGAAWNLEQDIGGMAHGWIFFSTCVGC